MIIDLATALTKAQQRSARWSDDRVIETLDVISKAMTGSVVDWDRPAGERWGRVLLAERVVVLVCTRLPLVIAAADAYNVVTGATRNEDVVVMPITDIGQHDFSIDKSQLEAVFGQPLSDSVDYAHLSAEELWWATV